MSPQKKPNTHREPDPAAVAEFQEVFGFTPTADNLPFLSELGLLTTEIGNLLGISHQAVEQRLERSGLSGLQRQRREQVLQAQKETEEKRLKTLEVICGQVQHHTHRQADKEGLAAQRALAYVEGRTKSLPYPFEHVVTLFERYQGWMENDLAFSGYHALVEGLPFTAPMGRKMILALDLPLPSYTEDFLTRAEKAALQRVYEYTMFSMSDIAYFLGKLGGTVGMHYHEKYSHRRRAEKPFLKQDKDDQKLTYRLASEIYSRQDAEMSSLNIAFVLDTSERIVQYAIDHKEEIAPAIIEGLRLLTGASISRPYLLREDRERIKHGH